MTALKVGDKAPDFSLPDQNGKIHKLSQYKGKTVILYFYPKDDTPGCTMQACDFRDHREEFADKNTVVLGVSKDDTDSHKKFEKKYSLTNPLLADTDASVCKAYGVYGPKMLYGKEIMGITRATFIIDPKGNIMKIYPKVNPEGHFKDLLSAIAA